MARKLSRQEIADNIKRTIASGRKVMELRVLNGILWRRLSGSHQRTYLKREPYLRNDPSFLASITTARNELGLTAVPDTSDMDYDGDNWVVEQISHKKADELSNEEFSAYYQQFGAQVYKILDEYKLSKDWRTYIEDFIILSKPDINFMTFPIPWNIKIEDVNEKGEVLLRLKPGLRHEDYERAWYVVSKPLGDAERISKPYTNLERNQQMLSDKENGMSYKEIARKYYPHQDPEVIVETVRKAIYRERQRQKRDK